MWHRRHFVSPSGSSTSHFIIGCGQPDVAKLHQRGQSSQSEADPLPAGWSKAALINSPELPTGTDTCFHPEISKEGRLWYKNTQPLHRPTRSAHRAPHPATHPPLPFRFSVHTVHGCFFIDDAYVPATNSNSHLKKKSRTFSLSCHPPGPPREFFLFRTSPPSRKASNPKL